MPHSASIPRQLQLSLPCRSKPTTSALAPFEPPLLFWLTCRRYENSGLTYAQVTGCWHRHTSRHSAVSRQACLIFWARGRSRPRWSRPRWSRPLWSRPRRSRWSRPWWSRPQRRPRPFTAVCTYSALLALLSRFFSFFTSINIFCFQQSGHAVMASHSGIAHHSTNAAATTIEGTPSGR
jgi:hypothetical protein